ncbi:hypothetical protein MRB53_039421 [Persea americana]|nr:hypothetical protein MRB53_039421 [Persea americana]
MRKKRAPELCTLVNRGSCFAFSDGKEIAGQQMGDGSLNCAAWFRTEDGDESEGRVKKLEAEDSAKARSRLKDMYHDWGREIAESRAEGRNIPEQTPVHAADRT